ncbi:MAG: hypothetical protein MUC95_02765 [Spirochaetes bacterium]|nr:hypothetical protein [Spirochaetota bacterium]
MPVHPAAQFALGIVQMNQLEPFLGEAVTNSAFTADASALSYWLNSEVGLYEGIDKLKEDFLKGKCFSSKEFLEYTREKPNLYPNLNLLARIILNPFDYVNSYNGAIDRVVLVRGPNPTDSPVLADKYSETE